MKRLVGMLAGASLLVLAGAAQADTITGAWSSSITTTSSHTTLTDSLSNSSGTFSVNTTALGNGNQPEGAFITVNPGGCTGTGCGAATATVNATISNLKDGSTSLLGGGFFSIVGTYTANYNNLTDALTWNSATGVTGTAGFPSGVSFANMQDGLAPQVLMVALADGLKTVDLFFVDGADWSVNTEVGASLAVASTPLPAALPMFLGGLGVIGLLSRRRKPSASIFA